MRLVLTYQTSSCHWNKLVWTVVWGEKIPFYQMWR